MFEGFRHQKAKLEGSIGDHFNNLYDENEDRAGQEIDESTGKKIMNSPPVEGADEKLRLIVNNSRSEDVLGALPEDDDAAAKWLRDNDPDLKKAA